MWIADNWQDYEVIDTSSGEKLERWGDFFLVRPDPQVIWKTDRTAPQWKKWDGYYHRSSKGGGSWENRGMPDEWSVSYPINNNRLTFRLKPFSFKHTGLFPEQAANWEWMTGILGKKRRDALSEDSSHALGMTERMSGTKEGGSATSREDRSLSLSKGPRVLNLFAYTGGATLAAAAAGAQVTHVDASKGMVAWAKENAAASGLSDAPIRWLVDDCVKFVEREMRRGNTYDGIIMDPPSYGRGPKGETWKMEERIYDLICKAVQLLSDHPCFFLISSYTTGLQPGVLKYMLAQALTLTVKSDRGSGTLSDLTVQRNVSSEESDSVPDPLSDFVRIQADELGLPVTSSGLFLPCGASCRAEFF